MSQPPRTQDDALGWPGILLLLLACLLVTLAILTLPECRP